MTAPAAGSAPPALAGVRLLLLPLVLGLVGLALTTFVPRGDGDLANLCFQWIIYLGWGWWALRTARGYGIAPLPMFRRPTEARDWRLVALFLPLLALSAASLVLQTGVLAALVPAVRAALATTTPDESQGLATTVLMAVTGATLVPVVEELVFRGVLWTAWSARYGERHATIATAVAFGVLHHDIVGAVIFGAVMTVLYRRTGSLLVPIATHACFNAVTGLATLGPDGESLSVADLVHDALPAVLVFAACLACLAFVLRRARFASALSGGTA